MKETWALVQTAKGLDQQDTTATIMKIYQWMGEVKSSDKDASSEDAKFKDDGTIQETEHPLREESSNCGICPGCNSIGRLNEVCLT